jgi:hypothetical protein
MEVMIKCRFKMVFGFIIKLLPSASMVQMGDQSERVSHVKFRDFWELKGFISCIACTQELKFGLMVISNNLEISS